MPLTALSMMSKQIRSRRRPTQGLPQTAAREAPTMITTPAKQPIHVLERQPLGLGVEEEQDGHAGGVDGHEEQVDARAQRVHADRPDLGHDDGAEGAERGREAEAAGAEGRGEDLCCLSQGALGERNYDCRSGLRWDFGGAEKRDEEETTTYLGPVDPRRRPEAHAVPKRVDEHKRHAHVVGRAVDVVGVNLRQRPVDLSDRRDVSSRCGTNAR